MKTEACVRRFEDFWQIWCKHLLSFSLFNLWPTIDDEFTNLISHCGHFQNLRNTLCLLFASNSFKYIMPQQWREGG